MSEALSSGMSVGMHYGGIVAGFMVALALGVVLVACIAFIAVVLWPS